MAKCMITGGAGFIGSHVASELLLEGHEVIVFDDLSGGFRENVPDGAKFIEGLSLTTNCWKNCLGKIISNIFSIWQLTQQKG